ncbi:hypothetical protein HMPREF0520_0449 [Lactobacillus iners DSM 13335]|uniref:Uncharacterized protein n=1 Tax=Lactobacillus iners DSM 13335 TaxID=525328 RepID=C8PBH9_9LACO|nr:hypothetical protein HMPREF0520_0449 [Lactobacillus iners DSM 13335]
MKLIFKKYGCFFTVKNRMQVVCIRVGFYFFFVKINNKNILQKEVHW